ncbi:hypothetical protein [Caulobacter vibrioides]|uniref:hypothetical protein n=1 Tax=Caulobacter vibrioides TaxID=155892 RepID=UPI001C5B67DF|nr:hypothetical protein [Caulobacter vibrioides]QXZ50191.1 hypothetical protein KZH45_09670 [Caulobacter vibrioides]
MTDLSKLQNRRDAAERITKNTDHILPRQRMTDTPQAMVRADMRNAYRGDQTDEVRKALGMVADTVGAVTELSQAQFADKERARANQAVQDQATGHIDAEAQKRSAAYAQVIATGTARVTAADLEGKAKVAIQQLLADGEHDLDDVNAKLDEVFKPALFEEDGKPKDYGSPEANSALYRALGEVRSQLHAGAQETIAGQVRAKGLQSVVDIVSLDAKKGVVSVEDGIAKAGALGIDAVTAKRELLPALVNTAIQTENPDLLLKAADSRKADGTRTWSAGEENSLRDQAITLRNTLDAKQDKEAAERSAATLGNMAVKVQQGFKITPQFVQQQIESGAIRPQDAQHLFGVQEHFDDEQRQKLQQRRADISWAQSQQDRAESRADRIQARAERAARRQADDLLIGIYQRGLSPAQAQRSIAALYAQRKIDGNTFRSMTEEVMQMPGDASVVSRLNAQDYEYTLKDVFTSAARLAGQPGYASVDEWDKRTQSGQLAFYRALRTGRTPADALRAGLSAAQLKDTFVDNMVRAARARDMTPTFTDQKKK